MRKFFTLLTMCFLATAVMAVEIEFDPAVDKGDFSGTQAKAYTVTKDGITIAVSNGMIAQYKDLFAYRVYKGQTATISSTIGNITGIEISTQVRNDTTWGGGGFVANVGTYNAPAGEYVANWYGDAAQVQLKAEAYQVRAIKIKVTVGEAGLIPPTITPAGGTYYEPINVNITCGAEGAKIYYTTDGNDPTTSSREFTAPFAVSSNMTVKAISALNGEVSNVVTAVYKFEEKPMFGFGKMWDVADETQVTFDYDATVIWQGGNNNNYLYAYDETGFGLVYGNTGQSYKIGDIIPAGFKGKKTTYKGEPELASPQGFKAAETFIVLTPEVITASQVNHDHWAHYVVIKNATISSDGKTITDASGSCEMYNNTFNVPLPSNLSTTHDIYGIVGVFSNYQVLPLSFDKAPERAPDPDPIDVKCIEELYDLSRTDKGHFTTPLTTIYQNGPYLYVQDYDGHYSLAYGSVAYTEFENGDFINDAISGWTTFGGNNQMVPVADTFIKAGHGDEVNPEIMPIEEVSADLVHWFLGFENVTVAQEGDDVYMQDVTGKLKLYDAHFKVLEGVDLSTIYYVEGFLTVYSDEMELFPTKVLYGPGYGIKGDVNNDGEINIGDVNALIDLILNGGDIDAATFWRADVAEDGELGLGDVNGLIDMILNM